MAEPRPARARANLDPRLKVGYLFALTTILFLTTDPRLLFSLLMLQGVLWIGSRVALGDLARSARRVVPFLLFVTATFVIFPDAETGGYPMRVDLFGLTVPLDLGGWWQGILMSARILTVILASAIVQRTTPGDDFVRALTGLGAPVIAAAALQITLALLAGSQPGQGAEARGERREGWRTIGRLLRGDTGPLGEMIASALRRGQAAAKEGEGGLDAQAAGDAGVIAGVALAGMAVKALRVFPGLPVAPGHKGLILIPLTVLAGKLTHSPWGATLTGVTMGTVAFLMGEGRFGIFEVAKYITPGILVDLVLRAGGGRPARPLGYCLLGLGVAIARFSTIVAVALFMSAPAALYALLVPIGIAHAVFGFLSGFVTYGLIKALPGRGFGPAARQPK